MFAHMKTSWTINSLKMCYILSAFCLLITSNHGDRCMWWITVNSFSSWSSYFSFTWHNYKIGKCFGPQEQSKAIVKGVITKHRFKVRKGVKRASFAADSWKARATGKELSSPSCAFLSYAHCAGLKRTLLKHRCTTLHLSVGSVHFSLFLPSPHGPGKNLFSFLSPTSRTVTFFAGYHRNILSISLFCEEGETRAKGRNECFFVRSSFPPLPTPPPS